MKFVLSGVSHELDMETVLKIADQNTPDVIDGRHKYYVNIKGRRYPVNQLFSLATGLNRSGGFITQDANRILSKLGFAIEEFRRPSHSTIQVSSTDSPQGYAEEKTENSITFAVSLEPDEDGYIVASCPQLPGCLSQGQSRLEAVRNIKEAIRGYTTSMKNHGEKIPKVEWELVTVDI